MLQLLGTIRAGDGMGEPASVGARRLRLLLAVLGSCHRRTVPTERLFDIVWPDGPPPSAETAMHGAISKIRRLFEPDLAPRAASAFLRTESSGYVLDLPDAEFDLATFAARTAQSGGPSEDSRDPVGALALWRDPPFAEFADEPWAIGSVAELRHARVETARQYYSEAIQRGAAGTVLPELAVDVTANPVDERLVGLLMTAHYQLGHQGEALRLFEVTRRRLRDELGLEPTPELVEVERLILDQDPKLTEMPLRADPSPPKGGPGRRGPLFGRSDELARAEDLLRDHRLVSLIGPPGVGKTRLAREVLDRRAVGGLFVDLSRVGEVDLVVPHLAERIELDGDPLSSPMASLASAMEETTFLVVLDNCEHLLPGLAAPIDDLLARTGELRVLATSRQTIGLARERLVRIEPFPVPDDQLRVGEVEALPVVRLLTECGSLEVTDGNAGALIELGRRLDGLPLALELAAFQLRSTSVESLVERWEDHAREQLPLDVSSRHRSLDDAIATSVWTLDDAHIRLLEAMSTFAGLVSIEVVVRLVADEFDSITVRTLLAGLVDRSLVSMVHVGSGVRYKLLQTVRAHLHRRLGDRRAQEELRLLGLLEHVAVMSLSGTSDTLMAMEVTEEISAMLDRLEEVGEDGPRHLRFVTAVASSWYGEGRVAEARLRLHAALRRHTDGPPFEIGSAKALLGMISFGVGAFDDLVRFTSEGLALLEPLEIPGLDLVRATGCVGRGELTEAQDLLELFLARPGLDSRTRLAALEVAATAAWFAGEHERAAARFADQQRLAEQSDDIHFISHARRGRAVMLAYGGQAEAGLALCRESRDDGARRHYRGVIEHHAAVAVILHELGDLPQAGREARATLQRCAHRFDAHAAAMAVPVLAASALADDDGAGGELAARLTGWFDGLCDATGLFPPKASGLLLNAVGAMGAGQLGPARWRRWRGEGALAGLPSIVARGRERMAGG